MKVKNQSSLNIFELNKYAIFLIAAWTFVLLLSLYWNYRHHSKEIVETASVQARSLFEKDLLYRQWSASHGGVYVPVTDKTPPNPYLEIPERDITTPSRKALTLMNPAYMTRQVYKLTLERFGVLSHITSLNPINPDNKPDPWEIEALKAFESGVEEVISSETIDGILHLRLMRPFITEEGCLKCHAKQGYKLGDIRGGASVSIPLHFYSGLMASKVKGEAVVHLLFWLMGLVGLYFGYVSIQRRVKERDAAEEELRESEDKYREIVEGTDDLVTVVNGKGEFIFTNHSSEKILGVAMPDIIGKNVFTFLHPDDKENTQEWFQNIVAEKRSTGHIENRQINQQTKETRYLQWTSNFHYDSNGNLDTVSGIAHDITEQKKIERELGLQHRLKELFMESMPCFAFLAKYDHIIVAINQAGMEMGGKEGVKCYSSKMTPFDKPCWWCLLPQLIETGERQYWEGYAVGIHWEAHWVPIDDDLYLHYAFDVSDKVMAQEQIKESEEKFRTTFMTIPDGIGLTRLSDNTFVDVNDGFIQISGYTADEVIGKPVLDVKIWNDARDRERFLKELMKKGQVYNFEAKGCRKDGSLFDALISAKSITLHGEPHLISIFKDITERKQTEQALQRSTHLATVGQIASGVAHELNNPLATIAACAEVLEKQATKIPPDLLLREKIEEYATLIGEEVERGSTIIKELLDFARIRPLDLTEFKLCDLIESTVKLLSIQSAYKEYSFEVSLCEAPPEILADRDRLRQVLIILLSNACEAQPDGGVVWVSCTNDIENQQVTFSVKDEGIGISPGETGRIFEPFFTTKLEEKGTGLGLSTAENIITKHGGSISVQSEQGKGSTFEVTLPVTANIQDEK